MNVFNIKSLQCGANHSLLTDRPSDIFSSRYSAEGKQWAQDMIAKIMYLAVVVCFTKHPSTTLSYINIALSCLRNV